MGVRGLVAGRAGEAGEAGEAGGNRNGRCGRPWSRERKNPGQRRRTGKEEKIPEKIVFLYK